MRYQVWWLSDQDVCSRYRGLRVRVAHLPNLFSIKIRSKYAGVFKCVAGLDSKCVRQSQSQNVCNQQNQFRKFQYINYKSWRQYGLVAQWLERQVDSWEVTGSNPGPVSCFDKNNRLGSGGVKKCPPPLNVRRRQNVPLR